jgi:cytochrome c-type biogenesis protein CcmH/NrfF
MRNRWITPLIAILAVIIFATACSSVASNPISASTTASTTTQDGAALLQERCTVCHPLSFVEKSRHTAADWKVIVDMMISRGAQLSSEEETLVINFLSTNYGQ